MPQVGLTVPKRWKDLCDGNRSQVTDQPTLGVGDDETLLRRLPADRRKPRIGEAGRRVVRLQLEPCDGQQSVDVGGVGLCSRTAQAGKRQSQGRCPGLHGNAWAGRTILRPLAWPRNSKVRSIPPPKPCQWVKGSLPGGGAFAVQPAGPALHDNGVRGSLSLRQHQRPGRPGACGGRQGLDPWRLGFEFQALSP